MFEVDVKNVTEGRRRREGPARVWGSDGENKFVKGSPSRWGGLATWDSSQNVGI